MNVDIVLATYNGDKYLEEQIDSILGQTFVDWNLIIRDDKSEDKTLQIIKKYVQKYPKKIFLIQDDEADSRLGASQNFSKLLKYSSAEYILFSDQDDIWLDNKIKYSLEHMWNLESSKGKALPILIHTDLSIVKANLELIHPSYWQHQYLDPQRSELNHFLVRNLITGCTVVVNRALKNLAIPVPDAAYMHDWWLALVAAAFGEISYLPESTILYRQHTSNEVGAQSKGLKDIISRFFQSRRSNLYFLKTFKQSQIFLERYSYLLTPEKYKLISEYVNLEKLNWLQKRKYLFQCNCWDVELLRKIFILSSM
jgi:glycosyltransferase involved in cell wall biosynthesis